jgi:hypothetical protein
VLESGQEVLHPDRQSAGRAQGHGRAGA